MVGITGSEGCGAILSAATGTLVVAPALAVVPAAISSGMKGSVGSGARVGTGVRVGQGVEVGWGAYVGDGDTPVVSANALAASRRATRSQATAKLIRLKAMMVALNPLPTLVGCLREFGLLVVILVALVVVLVILMVLMILVIFTFLVLPAAATAASAVVGRSRLAHGDLVVGSL